MEIKQIEKVRDDLLTVTWEDGSVENLQGQSAKTLLQMTEMKVGERYILTNTSGDTFLLDVVELTSECVKFKGVEGAEFDGEVYYRDSRLCSFQKTEQNSAKQRAEQELAELSKKVQNLFDFRFGDDFGKLSVHQQYLLDKQLGAMQEYEKILEARLSCWDN